MPNNPKRIPPRLTQFTAFPTLATFIFCTYTQCLNTLILECWDGPTPQHPASCRHLVL